MQCPREAAIVLDCDCVGSIACAKSSPRQHFGTRKYSNYHRGGVLQADPRWGTRLFPRDGAFPNPRRSTTVASSGPRDRRTASPRPLTVRDRGMAELPSGPRVAAGSEGLTRRAASAVLACVPPRLPSHSCGWSRDESWLASSGASPSYGGGGRGAGEAQLLSPRLDRFDPGWGCLQQKRADQRGRGYGPRVLREPKFRHHTESLCLRGQ